MSTLSAASTIACWGSYYFEHRAHPDEPWENDRELLDWSVLVHGLFPGFNIGVPCFWPLDRLRPTAVRSP